MSFFFFLPLRSLLPLSPSLYLHLPPSTIRDIQQEILKGAHSHWRRSFSFVNNHYLFLACFLVVVLSILLYLLRLRRIHRRMHLNQRNTTISSDMWAEQGLAPPSVLVTL